MIWLVSRRVRRGNKCRTRESGAGIKSCPAEPRRANERRKDMEYTMDKIVALAKNRGFVYPGSEIYGGLANTWDYGNIGVELKNNVKKAWW